MQNFSNPGWNARRKAYIDEHQERRDVFVSGNIAETLASAYLISLDNDLDALIILIDKVLNRSRGI